MKNEDIGKAMTIKLEFPNGLPKPKPFQEGIRRAPDRGFRLTPAQTEIALKNALRYIPEEYHEELIPEFLEELTTGAGSMAIGSVRKAGSTGNPLTNTKGNAPKARPSR